MSLWAIASPVLFVALCGSLLAAYINTIHAPSARASYKGILKDLVRNDPLREGRAGAFQRPQTGIEQLRAIDGGHDRGAWER